MENIYLLQCKICKKKDFTEEYIGAPLTCNNCGSIGMIEDIPNLDDEIALLIENMNQVQIQPNYSNQELEMINTADILNNQPLTLEQMITKMRIKNYKRPTKRIPKTTSK